MWSEWRKAGAARLHLRPNTVLRALSAEENGCKPAADEAGHVLPGSLLRAAPEPRARFCPGGQNLQTWAPFSTFTSQVRPGGGGSLCCSCCDSCLTCKTVVISWDMPQQRAFIRLQKWSCFSSAHRRIWTLEVPEQWVRLSILRQELWQIQHCYAHVFSIWMKRRAEV